MKTHITKEITTLLLITSLFGITGCGSSSDDSTPSNNNNPKEKPAIPENNNSIHSRVVGTWVLSDSNAPFDIILSMSDDGHYFMAQQTLGEDGVIGGLEVGTFTSTQTADFANAKPSINTNKGDTAVGLQAVVNTKTTPPTLDFKKDDGTLVHAKKLLPTSDHPEKAGWLIWDNTNKFDIMAFDGNGHYIFAQMDSAHPTMALNNGGRYNATEFGTYSLTKDTDKYVANLTPDAPTDMNVTCKNLGDAGCSTVAGDSNGDYGFNDLTDVSVEFPDKKTINITFTLNGKTKTASAELIRDR